MEERYLYRKIVSSAIVMALFATVVWLAGGMFGYYWSGLQGKISGLSISWQATPLGMQGFVGSTVFYLVLVIPVISFAILVAQGKRGRRAAWPFQVILVIPLFAYIMSAVFEVKKLKPIGRELLDVDIALDYAVYVPFALLGAMVALYMLLVIVLPASIGTRIFAIMTVLVCGVCYIVYAAFIIYNHMMSMLGGNFTTIQFGLYLVCFACDAVAFYFMLSVFMTFCAIRREDRIPLDDVDMAASPKRDEVAQVSSDQERLSGGYSEKGEPERARGTKERVPLYEAPAPESFEHVIAAASSELEKVEQAAASPGSKNGRRTSSSPETEKDRLVASSPSPETKKDRLVALPPEPENPKRLSGGRTGNDSTLVEGSSTVLGCPQRTPCGQTPPETVSDSPAPGSDKKKSRSKSSSKGGAKGGAKNNTKSNTKSNTSGNAKSNTKSDAVKASGGGSKSNTKNNNTKSSGGKAKGGKSSGSSSNVAK